MSLISIMDAISDVSLRSETAKTARQPLLIKMEKVCSKPAPSSKKVLKVLAYAESLLSIEEMDSPSSSSRTSAVRALVESERKSLVGC